jgi:hypothetical protein
MKKWKPWNMCPYIAKVNEDEKDEPNDYVTKVQLSGIQRALHQENEALADRIEQLATDLRQSEARTRDYLDAKLSTQMEEFRAMMVNRASSTSYSSRRRHSSRHPLDTPSDASLPCPHSHLRDDHQDNQASQNPIHGNGLQDCLRERE